MSIPPSRTSDIGRGYTVFAGTTDEIVCKGPHIGTIAVGSVHLDGRYYYAIGNETYVTTQKDNLPEHATTWTTDLDQYQ